MNIQQMKLQVMQLTQSKQYLNARQAAQQLVQLNPADIEAWYALAQLHEQLGEYEFAVKAYYKVCQSPSPMTVAAMEKAVDICVGEGFHQLGLVGAKALVYQVTNFKSAKALFNLGYLVSNLNEPISAINYFEKARELDGQDEECLSQLGLAYSQIRRHDKAFECFEQAMKIGGSSSAEFFNLYCLNCSDENDEPSLRVLHENYAKRFERGVKSVSLDKLDLNRPIRVGYVSPDFYNHSVAFYFQAIVESHTKGEFEVFCYSDVARPDGMTESIKSGADHWRDIRGKDDEAVFKQIKEDGIDVLVDLAGIVGVCRFGVFARRAAPVQVTYLGYPNTTGLKEMDYRLTDEWSDPGGQTDAYFTEELVRLQNGFLCYTPVDNAPEVSALPALSNGGEVCFGSFNNAQKITDQIIELWSKVILAVPGSRMLVKAKPFHEEQAREELLAKFEACGVERARVELIGQTPAQVSHLDVYSKVDIHLDTFPYNGTTTTCESLWQGVPTVTLAGKVHRSRVGLSLLKQVGLEQMIAADEDGYVSAAVKLASNLSALSELRESLRGRLESSVLMDREAFVSELEGAYKYMLKEKMNK